MTEFTAQSPRQSPLRDGTTDVVVLQAAALVQHGLPGPALGGRTGVELIACVCDAAGRAIESLPVSAFEVVHVAGTSGQPGRALRVADVTARAPGVYVVALETPHGGWTRDERNLVVLGIRAGHVAARALVTVDG